MFRDPLRRSTFIRMNNNYDQQEVIIENELSKKRVFQDLDTNTYLIEGSSKNTILMSSYIVKDEARDVVISKPHIVGRLERYKPPDRPGRHHTRRFF